MPSSARQKAQLWLYAQARRLLERDRHRALIDNPAVAAVRQLLFGPGDGAVVDADVHFEQLHLRFRAPLSVAHRASDRGIEARICRLILARCPRGGTCVDVGASYGFLSLVMASAVGPNGRVFAIESDPRTSELLAHNLRVNAMSTTAEAICARATACGSDPGPPTQLCIDDLIERRGVDRVDFVKIDVDGADLKVLQGMRRVLTEHRPLVAVEISRDAAEIYELLTDAGYGCADMGGRPADPANWPPNLLAAPDGEIVCPPGVRAFSPVAK